MPEQRDPGSHAPDAGAGRRRLPWGRRRASSAPAGHGPNRFERVLFSVMGPPQLGDVNAPVRQLPAVPAALCPKCGEPYDGHEVVRDPRLTYMRCPPPSS